MADEYLMWSLVAVDRHARPAPQSRSHTILCLCNSRSLAVLTREAKPFALSSSLVQGVAQSLLQSSARMAARMALVPPRLHPWRRRRLVGAQYRLSCPRSVVPVLVVRCMVDTVRILNTFLDLGLSFHTKDLGGRSIDMLLSLLTSESISSSSPPSSLWTRLTFENLTPGLDWPFFIDDFLPAGGCLSSVL